MAHAAILTILGHERFLYGSDFFVSHLRGKSVAASDSFVWLYANTPVWDDPNLCAQPTFVGIEHLRSLKWACWSLGLSDSQIEDIFWNNAVRLLNV